jgi:hypothetical protein
VSGGFSAAHPEAGVRATYVALALATIAAGLAVHLGRLPSSPALRDVLADALWAAMLTWWVSALAPRLALGARAALALGACYAVEVSQLYHTPALDAVRATRLGHLVLGSGFDPRDFAAYALGVLGAAVLDRGWRRRRTTTQRYRVAG